MSSEQSIYKVPVLKTTKNIPKKGAHIHTSPSINRIKSEKLIKQHPDFVMDEQKIQTQLIKEIQSARLTIKEYQSNILYPEYQNYLKQPKTNFNNFQQHLDELRSMEQIIGGKDEEVKRLNEEINLLKIAPDKMCNDLINPYKSIKDAQLFLLADQILSQNQELLSIQKDHSRKRRQLEKRHQLMKGLQKKYIKIHKEANKNFVTFEEFKKMKKKKEKEDQQNKVMKKVSSRRQIKQIKEVKQMEGEEKGVRVSSNSTNNLRDVRNKKQIAESALRTLKKKHNSEINELKGKLQFLTDQNQTLELKLIQKMKQLEAADTRFSERAIYPHTKYRR